MYSLSAGPLVSDCLSGSVAVYTVPRQRGTGEKVKEEEREREKREERREEQREGEEEEERGKETKGLGYT